VIALRLTVPVACWRKGHAREFLETEIVPPPATCYGALLALVGEVDRDCHRGARVTGGVVNHPDRSTVVRTLWRIKDKKTPQGVGENAKPDFQELWTNAEVLILCDSSDETAVDTLEKRVGAAIERPDTIERFGGWSLGESTHLVNDVAVVPLDTAFVGDRVFLLHPEGDVTLPVWVDHVGSAGTRYAVGRLEPMASATAQRVPTITDGSHA
jgi:CRISPR-associated protein Cas5t